MGKFNTHNTLIISTIMTKVKMLFVLFTSGVFLLIGCQTQSSDRLNVATAANMQFAMKELTTAFARETGIECEAILGSSGKLTAQIKAGAPYHVFVSADMAYPQALTSQGFSSNSPQVYAYGKLVIWTQKNFELNHLSGLNPGHVALANPQTAPYGRAAEEALKAMNLYEAWKDKLVFGESISQVNQFVSSGAADIGFTSKSVVLAPVLTNKGNWIEVDSSLYKPIEQGVVLLKSSPEKERQAREFLEFLFSPAAKEILDKFGYTAAG